MEALPAEVALKLHGVVKDAQDQDEIVRRRQVDDQVARRAHGPAPAGCASPAMAQMIGADALPQFRSGRAGGPQRIAQKVGQAGGDEGGVAVARGCAEVRPARPKDLRDVGSGGLGEVEAARQALDSPARPRSAT